MTSYDFLNAPKYVSDPSHSNFSDDIQQNMYFHFAQSDPIKKHQSDSTQPTGLQLVCPLVRRALSPGPGWPEVRAGRQRQGQRQERTAPTQTRSNPKGLKHNLKSLFCIKS